MQLIIMPERTTKERKNSVYDSFRVSIIARILSKGVLSVIANDRANPPLDIDLQHSAPGLGLGGVFLWLGIGVEGIRALKHPCWFVHLPEGGVMQGFEATSFHLLLISRQRQNKHFCLARAPRRSIFIHASVAGKHSGRAHQRISAHSNARAPYQRAVEGFELSVFFAFVDVLSQAIGYVETRQASSVTRPEGLHESVRQFVMRIKSEVDCASIFLISAPRIGFARRSMNSAYVWRSISLSASPRCSQSSRNEIVSWKICGGCFLGIHYAIVVNALLHGISHRN